MAFSATFFELFFWGVYLGAPIFIALSLIITSLGLWVGKMESWKTFDSLYWAYITALTVGYGDMRPSTKISKAVSIIIAWCGILFTGLLVAVAVKSASYSYEEHLDQATLKKVEQHIKDNHEN